MADTDTLLGGSPYVAGLAPRGRIVAAFPPSMPAALPDGRIPVFRFLGRFNALSLPGLQPLAIARANEARITLLLQNAAAAGGGNVYISDRADIETGQGLVIFPASSLVLDWPNAPMGTLYAVADATHDLRVTEVFFGLPSDFISTAEDGVEIGSSDGDE